MSVKHCCALCGAERKLIKEKFTMYEVTVDAEVSLCPECDHTWINALQNERIDIQIMRALADDRDAWKAKYEEIKFRMDGLEK